MMLKASVLASVAVLAEAGDFLFAEQPAAEKLADEALDKVVAVGQDATSCNRWRRRKRRDTSVAFYIIRM